MGRNIDGRKMGKLIRVFAENQCSVYSIQREERDTIPSFGGKLRRHTNLRNAGEGRGNLSAINFSAFPLPVLVIP
jgi:hypothetical protein